MKIEKQQGLNQVVEVECWALQAEGIAFPILFLRSKIDTYDRWKVFDWS